MSKKIDISIIICTFNQVSLLKKCLDSLAKMDKKNCLTFEVIIVNNNSSDNTEEIASEFIKHNPKINTVYCLAKEKGSSNARNTGIKMSKGKFLAFLDDDVIVDHDWLKELSRAINEIPNLAGYGGLAIAYSPNVPNWFPIELASYDLGNKNFAFTTNVKEPIGANMGIRKDILVKNGLFNPKLGIHGNIRGWGEDTEVIQKVIRSGKLVMYLSKLRVKHFVSPYKLNYWWRIKSKYQKIQTSIKLSKDLQEVNNYKRFTLDRVKVYSQEVFKNIGWPKRFYYLSLIIVSYLSLYTSLLMYRKH